MKRKSCWEFAAYQVQHRISVKLALASGLGVALTLSCTSNSGLRPKRSSPVISVCTNSFALSCSSEPQSSETRVAQKPKTLVAAKTHAAVDAASRVLMAGCKRSLITADALLTYLERMSQIDLACQSSRASDFNRLTDCIRRKSTQQHISPLSNFHLLQPFR